jgi:hypothetical protein
VGDTVLPLEDPSALQLDVLGSEVVEEAAPLAEEHRDEMDLELVAGLAGMESTAPTEPFSLRNQRSLAANSACTMQATPLNRHPET